MLTQKDKLIAEEFKEKLAQVATILDFRVFGSRARGDNAPESDLDVFLEIRESEKKVLEKISDVAWEVGFPHYTVITPIIFTQDEIENTPLRSSSLVKVIQEEGIRL